jgi:hypothetical protein
MRHGRWARRGWGDMVVVVGVRVARRVRGVAKTGPMVVGGGGAQASQQHACQPCCAAAVIITCSRDELRTRWSMPTLPLTNTLVMYVPCGRDTRAVSRLGQ